MNTTIEISKSENGYYTTLNFSSPYDWDAFMVLFKRTFGNKLEDRDYKKEENVIKFSSFFFGSDIVEMAVKAYIYENPSVKLIHKQYE